MALGGPKYFGFLSSTNLISWLPIGLEPNSIDIVEPTLWSLSYEDVNKYCIIDAYVNSLGATMMDITTAHVSCGQVLITLKRQLIVKVQSLPCLFYSC